MEIDRLANLRVFYNRMPKTTSHPTPNKASVEHLNALLKHLALLCNVPSALIMQRHEHEIEVFASADTGETPYKVGDKEFLNSGLYCEYVMENKTCLIVPDAKEDSAWSNNPDIKLGMISYLGYPLQWPDGEIFGTICILDRKKNAHSKEVQATVDLFKSIAEDQLALLFEHQQTKKALTALQNNRDELSQAVRVAVDATVKNVKLVESVSKDLTNVLEALVPVIESPSPTDESFNAIQNKLKKVVNRITQLSASLTSGDRSENTSQSTKRTH